MAEDEWVRAGKGSNALLCGEGVAADVVGAVESKCAADLVVRDELLELCGVKGGVEAVVA